MSKSVTDNKTYERQEDVGKGSAGAFNRRSLLGMLGRSAAGVAVAGDLLSTCRSPGILQGEITESDPELARNCVPKKDASDELITAFTLNINGYKDNKPIHVKRSDGERIYERVNALCFHDNKTGARVIGFRRTNDKKTSRTAPELLRAHPLA